MWDIRTFAKKGSERILKSGFDTRREAEGYQSKHYPDTKTFIGETGASMLEDLSENVGKWLWIYSPIKQEMFPYGIIVSCGKYFTKIQTNELAKANNYFPELQTKTIQKWLLTGKGEIREEGEYVNIKDFV